MAYIFGAAIKGIWGTVFPPHPTASDIDTDTPTTTTTTTTSSSDNMDSAEEIPWNDITEAHVSNLRGHVRYLKNIGTKLNVADKLEDCKSPIITIPTTQTDTPPPNPHCSQQLN